MREKEKRLLSGPQVSTLHVPASRLALLTHPRRRHCRNDHSQQHPADPRKAQLIGTGHNVLHVAALPHRDPQLAVVRAQPPLRPLLSEEPLFQDQVKQGKLRGSLARHRHRLRHPHLRQLDHPVLQHLWPGEQPPAGELQTILAERRRPAQ